MQFKFHILILIIFLGPWSTQVDAVLEMIGQRVAFAGRSVAANGGFASIATKFGRAPVQIVRNGGLQQMPKPQVVPKVPKNPLLQTKMPLKKVPPPTNATLAKRAADTLSLRVSRLSEQIKKVKQKAYFGLDQMPAHGNEVVYIAEALTKTGKVNAQMVRRMLAYTGKTIYNGIWKASKAIQRLPFRTRATLLTIATIADVGHTIDEYWQVVLLSKIAPDQIGIGLPKNLQEWAEGLNNFWWDAWPDFAFGVPLVFFGLNPPLLILTQTYKTLFEYVGKKVIGEYLKDYVWPSEFAPVQGLDMFMAKEVAAAKVFDADADDNDQPLNLAEEIAKMEAEKKEEAKSGETKTVEQALLDSQKDSNLYKYFALNSMRSIFVLAVAIQVEFFTLVESSPEDKLSDLAKESKGKMNEKMVKETKEVFEKEMVQKVVNFSNKPAEVEIDTKKRDQILKETVKKFETEIKPKLDSISMENENLQKRVDQINDMMNTGVKSNQLNNAKKEAQQKLDSNVSENVNLKKKIDESNAEINPVDSDMKPMLLRMAKATAQRMAFKRVEATASSPEEVELHNWATTLAHLISDASTTEGLIRMAMVEAKNLEQRKLPEENYEQPKVVDGKLIFPQCSKEMSELTKLEYEAQKKGQDVKDFMKLRGIAMPKFEIHAGSKAKRWASPYCSIPNEAGFLNRKGLAEILNDFPQQEQRFMAFPVYAKEVVKRMTVLFAAHKVILIQRAAKKMAIKRRSTNKIGQQPVQKSKEKVGVL